MECDHSLTHSVTHSDALELTRSVSPCVNEFDDDADADEEEDDRAAGVIKSE